MSKIVDLSHILANFTPVYPGDHQALFEVDENLKRSNIQVTNMEMNTHLATHLDFPAHLGIDTFNSSNVDLNDCFGKAIVIDARASKDNLIKTDILPLEYNQYDYLLFYTAHSKKWGQDEYFNSYPYFSSSLVNILAKSSLKGVGVDTASVDKAGNQELKNHYKLLKNGKIIIENLTNLEQLVNQEFTLFAFPLKIKNGDGSPVRAIALKS